MPLPHLLLALATVLVWGLNYVAIGLGLHNVPPMLLAAYRFAFSAFPLVLFRPRPRIPAQLLIEYSLCMFVVQLGFLFLGIRAGLPAGTASLVLQVHVFITLGLAMAFRAERPRPVQVLGALVAFAGVAVVGMHMASHASLLGFGLALVSAAGWALGNDLVKRIGPVDLLALMAWASLLAVPVLLAGSAVLDGPAALVSGTLRLFTRSGLALVLFQAYGATLFGFWGWAYLLRHHPAAVVAPLSMLVPVFSMLGGALFLAEPITAWKGAAGALVLAGLTLNQTVGLRARRA